MAKYIRKEMSRLAHQLTLSPLRLREAQLAGAEALAGIIEPDKNYPYDFVCYRITGYRKSNGTSGAVLRGKDLLADLSALVDDLSRTCPRPVQDAGEPILAPSELAGRLNVSTKTISRWRGRGLIGRRYKFAEGKVAVGFSNSSVERFVKANEGLVKRAAAFKQLTCEERREIIRQARELLARRRMKLHEVAQELAARTGRAVETIRYTLRRYDRENPSEAVFAKDESPQVCPEHRRIFECYQAGDSVSSIAAAVGKPSAVVARIILEMRCRRILDAPLQWMYSPEFDAPDAEQTILAEDVADSIDYLRPDGRNAAGALPYFNDLASLPVLTPQQERDLFRQYNYLKFRVSQLREGLDPLSADPELVERIEQLLARVQKAKNALIQCNLRLVVNIAKRHVGNSPDLFEVVSDGNISVMQAVEKFDYTRGNKFSTYATWAIVRNYARTIPERRYQQRRFQTGSEELLDIAPDGSNATEAQWERKGLRERIGAALGELDDRERQVVLQHFGLNGAGKSQTLEQIGRSMGVTKERIRQIEKRALGKLQALLPESLLDLISD
jgi:RNA polymerase sigma factor (sigma-70 family)